MLDRTRSEDDSTRSAASERDGRAANGPKGAGNSRIGTVLRAALQCVVMLLVLGGGVYGMQTLIDSRAERTPQGRVPTVYPIEAQTAEAGTRQPTITVYGQAVAARQVELRPLVGGEIVAIHDELSAGASIAAGETLVAIDPFAYEGALTDAQAAREQTGASISEVEARIAAAEQTTAALREQLRFAETDLERARGLADSGQIPAQQLEQRQLLVSQRAQAVAEAQANVATLRAQLRQQNAALSRQDWQVRQAERNLANTELKAPFDAVVRSASAEIGRNLSASDVVATLYDAGRIEARFTLSDSQYGRLSTDDAPIIGRPVEAVWTIGGERLSYAGRIVRIGAEVDSAAGGVELFAALSPAAGNDTALRPGSFLTLTVPDKSFEDSFSLPDVAVYDGGAVFVVEEGELRRRAVNIIAYDGDRAIIDAGLEPGEIVMTTRLSEAMDGSLVNMLRLDGEPVAAGDDEPDTANPAAASRGSGEAAAGEGRSAS